MAIFLDSKFLGHRATKAFQNDDHRGKTIDALLAKEKGDARPMRDVEDFIYYVRSQKQAVASLNLSSTTRTGNAQISKYYFAIHSMIKASCLLPTKYVYSISIEIFISACLKQSLIQEGADGKRYAVLGKFKDLDDVQSFDTFVQFVNAIDEICRSPKFRSKLVNAWKLQEYRRESFTKFVDDLFYVHSRIIVLRVDLYYNNATKDLVDGSDALDDLDRLVANMRHNSIFDDLLGSIFRVEYGLDRGVHIHSVFFFNGSIRNGLYHVHYAKLIGEYWKQHITQGKGDYWNVNAKIDEYKAKGICGIGLICASDELMINNLIGLVVHYVCKERQTIRLKDSPARKMIRKSCAPETFGVKRGRPRLAQTNSLC
ncbi:inovirus-type Gp2 protein [Undibacterium sp. LX40W]|uniref:Inovirus-type Gp2 protein n=1 Tax=Undibacterium nitidum TaxID=2762298 RepID=A0A923HM97_9BURK|nr:MULTISPECIES: inovirus-type Gp2 protein [Undibacterium]MBC3880253.1 inovirus-type Gp2 protein [Undibacterium nitidum]MBC3891011.1 inovirus-type Gp2 protein [Undibacterium sp. LX40W]